MTIDDLTTELLRRHQECRSAGLLVGAPADVADDTMRQIAGLVAETGCRALRPGHWNGGRHRIERSAERKAVKSGVLALIGIIALRWLLSALFSHFWDWMVSERTENRATARELGAGLPPWSIEDDRDDPVEAL